MTRVLLATDDVGLELRLLEGLADGRALCRRRPELRYLLPGKVLHELADEGADVLVLDAADETDAALALAQTLDRERPALTVLLIAPQSPQLWERALRAGVRDVLAPTADAATLGESVQRALQSTDRLRVELSSSPSTGSGPRVITVLSPKGGAGKTTVATNLAVGLAFRGADQVAVVDLDLQFGDVAGALQLDPDHTLADVRGAIDPTAIKVFLTPHPSGLFALCAPEDPAGAEETSPDQVGQLLQVLATEMSHVVVDTSAGIDEATLAAIEASTDLVLVGAMDVPSVRGLRKELAALDRLGMTSQRRHLVLNRADTKVGLTAADVEAALGLPVDVAVPSARAVPLSVNTGSPVVEAEPRSPVAKALGQLVARFLDEPGDARAASRWSRRAGR